MKFKNITRHDGSEGERLPFWLEEADIESAEIVIEKNGTVNWINGIWHDGVFRGHRWVNGIWKNGIWYGDYWNDGLWMSGEWNGGIFVNGVWLNGVFSDGEFVSGIWKDGYFIDGVFRDASWAGGTWFGGIWEGGGTELVERKIYTYSIATSVFSPADISKSMKRKKKNY